MSESTPLCITCIIAVKDPGTPVFKLTLSSVCNARCVEEIIVVTPHPEELAWVKDACTKVRLVRDPGWGIGIARNLGVENSKCEIIAFVDSDAIVGRNHFCEILKAFEDQDVGLVDVMSTFDGRITNLVTKVQALENLVWKHGRVAKFEESGDVIYANGTFMSLRKSVWKAVGGFWSYPPYSCEDMEFSYKVYKAGYRCKSIKVQGSFHLPRATLPELFREQYGWGKGFAILLLKYLHDRDFWLSLRFNRMFYRIMPGDCWFLIPLMRILATPLGGLANAVK